MILDGGIAGIAMLGFLVYCVFDCVRTDNSKVQNLPKILWLLVIVFLPLVGPLAWILLGKAPRPVFNIRPRGTLSREHPAAEQVTSAEPKLTPEDFSERRERALKRYEAERASKRAAEELKRREEETKRRDSGGSAAPS